MPSLKAVAGLDINITKLQKLAREVECAIVDAPSDIQSCQLWSGSMLHSSFLKDLKDRFERTAGGIDGIACIEVIEHLPSVCDATNGVVNILSILRPQKAVITTPNYDANPVSWHGVHVVS